MVVLFHLEMFTDTTLIKNGFVHHANLFVDFFFVLSGFVIAYNYQNIETGTQLNTFFSKRFFRLYPLHFLMLMIFLAEESVKHIAANYVQVNNLNWIGNNINSFFTSLFLLNSVKLPGILDVSWNMPSWSISAEMISYVFFGLLLFLINKSKAGAYKNYIYIVVVLTGMYAIFYLTGSLRLTYTYEYGFLRGLIGFFTGLLCYNTYREVKELFSKFSRLFFNISELVLIVFIIYMVSEGERYLDQGYIYEILFFTSILVFAFQRGIVSDNLKRFEVLHNLGKYSYSIYMTHILIISLFNVLFIRVLKFSPSSYSYLFILNFYIIYKISEWTYKNIEMRFMKRKKPVETTASPVLETAA